MKQSQKDILLNEFARRCFRDIADKDYIHARLGFRAKLMPQFLWSSLQTIEKYFKCILLYNRIKAKNLNHHLEKAHNKIKAIDKFEFTLSDEICSFITKLDTFARFRYLEVSYYTQTVDLPLLDKSVWEIRRYCQKLDHKTKNKDGEIINWLKINLDQIKKSETKPPINFSLVGGYLEEVIKCKTHPSREPLLWNNTFFGLRNRKRVTLYNRYEASFAPLANHPEILDEASKYVFIPREVKKVYKNKQGNYDRLKK